MSTRFEDETYESLSANPDQLEEMIEEAETHPSIEMTLLRDAIRKTLMNSQRELWEMHAYDKLNTQEIADKLNTSRQNVSQRIKVIEKKIIRYCTEHREAYLALKDAENDSDMGC